jgi:hypothetical protein
VDVDPVVYDEDPPLADQRAWTDKRRSASPRRRKMIDGPVGAPRHQAR